jgi:hypothetical protein
MTETSLLAALRLDEGGDGGIQAKFKNDSTG